MLRDRSSLRGFAFVSLLGGVLCALFTTLAFRMMLVMTRSFTGAFQLWRQDRGQIVVFLAAPILVLGGLLTHTRLRHAKSWAQLSRTDRVLAVIGIIPAAPLAIAALALGMAIFFSLLVMMQVTRWKPRGQTR